MATKQLTADQQAEMDALGLTTEEYEAANTRDELAAGTYRFQIASGKVEIRGGDSVVTDAIQVDFRVVPVDSAGTPVPKLRTFFKFVLPMKHGRYVPNAISLQVGMSTLRGLAAAGNTTVPALVESFKNLNMPVELIGANIVGNLAYKPSKNDPSAKFAEVRLNTSKEPKLTAFKAPASSTGGSDVIAQAAARNNAAADSEVPF